MICLDSAMTYSGIHVAVFLQCVKTLVSSSPLRLAPCITSSILTPPTPHILNNVNIDLLNDMSRQHHDIEWNTCGSVSTVS